MKSSPIAYGVFKSLSADHSRGIDKSVDGKNFVMGFNMLEVIELIDGVFWMKWYERNKIDWKLNSAEGSNPKFKINKIVQIKNWFFNFNTSQHALLNNFHSNAHSVKCFLIN